MHAYSVFAITKKLFNIIDLEHQRKAKHLQDLFFGFHEVFALGLTSSIWQI